MLKNTYNHYYSFNKCLGIDEDYDNVNKPMYFDNLKDVRNYADEINGHIKIDYAKTHSLAIVNQS